MDKLLNELRQLAAAGKAGNFDAAFKPDGLTREETEIAGLITEIIGNYRTATEYNLIKYKLANDALGIALWDMEVVSADPVNSNNTFIWSQEFRELLGFSDENDFPNVLSSWSDRIHPEDKVKTLEAFAAHINDYTGHTPYNIEYHLMHKNGTYRYYHAFGTTLRDSAGTPLRVAGAVLDIEERKNTQNQLITANKALEHSNRLTDALSEMAMLFLSRNEKSFNNIMNAGIERIARLTEIDRFSIFHSFAEDGITHISQIYRWEKASGGTTETNKKFVNIAWEQFAPSWEQAFSGNEVINGPVRLMPENEAAKLSKIGMVSVFATPIYINSIFWGFVLFENHRTECVLDDDLARTMRQAAFLCATTVMRNNMEHALGAEKKFIRDIIDTAPVGVVIRDMNFNVIDCNDAFIDILGAPAKQYYAEHFKEFMPEYQLDGQISAVKTELLHKRALEGEELVTEWIFRSSAGENIPCELTMARVKRTDRYVVLTYIYDLRNIKRMEREIAEVKLHEADEQLQKIFDATPLGVNLWDKDLHTVKINEEAVKLFGLSCRQDYSDNFFNLSPKYQPNGELSSELAIELLRKAFEEGYSRFEWIHQKLDGEQIPCEITLVRVKYKDDYVVAGYTRDLREIKAYVAEIQKKVDAENAIDYMSSILNSLEVMVCVTDPKTFQLLFINNSMKQYFGITDDCVGQTCYKVLHKRDAICEHCPRLELETEPDKIIVWEEHNTFNDRVYRNVDRNIHWPGGQTVIMRHSVDITELIAAKNSAEQSNRSKDIFLAHMSHEIRTPMNAILGTAEIQLFNERLSPETKEGFIRIYESGNLLLNIINDILDFSKIEADKMEIVLHKYDVPSMINDIVQLNRLHYESKPIDFLLQVDENVPLELIGDELRIKQILNNLLSNAFKYTGTGEVELSVSTETEPDNETVMLIISVRDTGQGLNEDQVARLFDKYTRFNMETNRGISGTGLGMNITKRLLGMMDGSISVESKVGVGTLFTVRLPQKNCDSVLCGPGIAENLRSFSYRNKSMSAKAPIEHEYMPHGRVLVVDDVESNLYVAKGLLVPYGLTIETAKSGFEAIEKIKKNNTYDILFMDHMMPKMDGIKATELIRGMGYTQPIIALTANAVVGQAEMFLSNGFDDFLSKPINSHELNKILTRFIQGSKTIDVPVTVQENETDELKKFFARDAREAIEALTGIYTRLNDSDAADMELFVTAVHGIKSALAIIGETELSEIALRLENEGNAKNIPVIKEETPAFISALQSLIGKDSMAEKSDTAEISADDTVFLFEKMNAIIKECKASDIKAAKTTLSGLKEKNWPHAIDNVLDEISVGLLHSEFADVINIAEKAVNTFCFTETDF